MKIGDVLLIAVLVFILFLAVMAIIRGCVGISKSNSIKSSKKARIGYRIVSILHLIAGILITVCYIIAIVLISFNYFRQVS